MECSSNNFTQFHIKAEPTTAAVEKTEHNCVNGCSNRLFSNKVKVTGHIIKNTKLTELLEEVSHAKASDRSTAFNQNMSKVELRLTNKTFMTFVEKGLVNHIEICFQNSVLDTSVNAKDQERLPVKIGQHDAKGHIEQYNVCSPSLGLSYNCNSAVQVQNSNTESNLPQNIDTAETSAINGRQFTIASELLVTIGYDCLDNGSFKCCGCENTFRTFNGLRNHMLVHSNEKLFECNKTPVGSNYLQEGLQLHILQVNSKTHEFKTKGNDHHSEVAKLKNTSQSHAINAVSEKTEVLCVTKNKKLFHCNLCDSSFSQNANLKRHIRTHTGEKPFKCLVCCKQYTTKNSLEYHIKSHTGEKPFQCTDCGFCFKTHKQLRYHLWRKHSKPDKALENSKGTYFNCGVCRKVCVTDTHLRQHMQSHRKPFRCNICLVSFSLKGNLIRHFETRGHKEQCAVGAGCEEHTESSFHCAESDCSFKTSSDLKHLLNHHSMSKKILNVQTNEILKAHKEYSTKEKFANTDREIYKMNDESANTELCKEELLLKNEFENDSDTNLDCL